MSEVSLFLRLLGPRLAGGRTGGRSYFQGLTLRALEPPLAEELRALGALDSELPADMRLDMRPAAKQADITT